MRALSRVLTGCLLICGSLAYERASASTFDFVDVDGDTVVFSDLTEANYSLPPGESLFAALSGTDDSIRFQTLNLGIDSLGGADALNGRVVFNVTAKEGYEIEGVTVTQKLNARTFDESTLQFDLLGKLTSGGTELDLATSFEKTSAAGDGLDTETPTISLSFAFDPTASIELDLLNQLFAAVSQNGAGFLASTQLKIAVHTIESAVTATDVPEPGTALALLVGCGGVAIRRRTRCAR